MKTDDAEAEVADGIQIFPPSTIIPNSLSAKYNFGIFYRVKKNNLFSDTLP
jgi:hypothetical protein